MKALIYERFGTPEVLRWVSDWPAPRITTDGVLVESVAGGVNPKDALLRKGKFSRTLARDPLPRVSGLDVAGTVVDVGGAVSRYRVGDTVFAMTNRFSGGVHAEFAALRVDEIAHAPANITLQQASAVPLAAQTALQALRDCCAVARGARVLIVGASGGVGHFAVQIAKLLDARVDAVCGPGHIEFVRGLGADTVHDYKQTPAPEINECFDGVLDVFGAYTARRFKHQLGDTGVYTSTVPKAATMAGELLARTGVHRQSRLVAVKSRASDLTQLRAWIESERVVPYIDAVYPAEQADRAHGHIETKHTTGKVVISF